MIENKKQYHMALKRFEEIFLAKSNTKEGQEAQALSLIIKKFEDKHYPITSKRSVISNTQNN